MSRDKLFDVNDPYMHASVNVGYQGKSGPGKIHEVILVIIETEMKVVVSFWLV